MQKKMFKTNSDYIVRKVADEYLVIGVNSMDAQNKLMMLNETGCFIWDCLKEETALDAVVEKVKAEFDVEENILEQDIEEFVMSLVRAGLVEERS